MADVQAGGRPDKKSARDGMREEPKPLAGSLLARPPAAQDAGLARGLARGEHSRKIYLASTTQARMSNFEQPTQRRPSDTL